MLLAGCLQERLAWAPDGSRLAVVTADGLHLADPTGRISPLLAPGVYRAAWLPDSQRLALARKKPVGTFAEVAAALGPARSQALAAKAESIGKMLPELPRSKELDQRLLEEIGEDLAGVLAYLREQPRHLATLRERLGTDWKTEDETKPVDLHEIVVAQVQGATLAIGPSLWVGLPGINALRPSPGGQAVAFTARIELSPHPDNGISVHVAPTDASAPAVVVATQSTVDPDWTRDGRALVFFKAAGQAGGNDDLRLGALVQREILDAAGRIKPADESRDLAGVIFHQRNRVRCLRDGRVVFNASPFTLPMVGNDHSGREQLFELQRSPSLAVRPLISPAQRPQLPDALSAFEISPDESQVAFASDKGAVWVFTLASDTVERITAALESDRGKHEGENYPAPVWRAPGEFTFLRKVAPAAGTSPFELVLHHSGSETVLSRTWDSALLRRLIE